MEKAEQTSVYEIQRKSCQKIDCKYVKPKYRRACHHSPIETPQVA